MRLYLSSFRIGDDPSKLVSIFGQSKRVAIIANATDLNAPDDRAAKVEYEHSVLRELGFETEEIDLRDFFDTQDQLRTVIVKFDCIWVRGGNVFLLRRAFRQSGLDTFLDELLKSDKISYGGYSAGVCILSPTLKGLELVDEPYQTITPYRSEVIWDGLNIIPYSVAPHFDSDHPESAAINDCVAYFEKHDLPYKTLRDGEVIIPN